jgi:rhodanese-related sulfurtransferase
MCRTGGRSHNAAAVAASLGYTQAYNMLEGFEGEANGLNQRTMLNGWKHAGLPWTN